MNTRSGFIHRLCVSLMTLALLSACGGGDDADDPTPPAPAPASISYPSPQTLVVGTAVNLTPTANGSPASYSVTPALPAGLTLNATTGVISGSPTSVTPQATYTVSATASTGAVSFALSLTVNPAAPSALSYDSPMTITAGTAIAPATPTVTGTVTNYAVNPALPAGLALNPASGEISGTPTAATALAAYVVTASNVTGSTTFNLEILVNAAPQIATGVFIDSVVSGLSFASGGQSGVTDANGTFSYEVSQPVTFSVGGVEIGTTAGKDAVTPLDLVAGSTGATPEVVNIVRFLMLLDTDGNAANGITISDALRERAAGWPQIDFSTSDLDAALAAIIPDTEVDGAIRALPAANAATAHFATSFRCAMSGYYNGTFTGGDDGYFAFTITPNGAIAGGGYSTVEDEFAALLFNPNVLPVENDAVFVAGVASTGSSFSGRLNGYDEVAGTWTDGTFSGARYAGTTTAAYKYLAFIRFNGNVVGSAFLEIDADDVVTLTPHVDFRTNVRGDGATAPLENDTFEITGPNGSFTVTFDRTALTLSGTWTNTANGSSGPIDGGGCRLK